MTKNSQDSVKKRQKCKFRWEKSQTIEKRYKNVNLGDKKSQHNVKKTEKWKFKWKKATTV